MSRTLKDVPWEVWKERNPIEAGWGGYPPPIGGAWPGRKGWSKIRNKQLKMAQKRAIHNEEEVPRFKKGQVSYDIW